MLHFCESEAKSNFVFGYKVCMLALNDVLSGTRHMIFCGSMFAQ